MLTLLVFQAVAIALANGATLTGNLASSQIVDFVLNVAFDSSSVYFSTCDSLFDTQLFVYDSTKTTLLSGSLCDGDDCGICSNGNSAREDFTLGMNAGTYVVQFNAYGTGSGAYTLVVDCTGCSIAGTAPPTPSPTAIPTTEPTDRCYGVTCPGHLACNPLTGACERDCDIFNIDGFLTECSADFPAEQEALEAVETRVSTLESEMATVTNLNATDAALRTLMSDVLELETEAATITSLTSTNAEVDALKANITALKTEAATRVEFQALESEVASTDADVDVLRANITTLKSEAATSTALAATDVNVAALSSRLDSIEETLTGFSSARAASVQHEAPPTATATNIRTWSLLADKDLIIVISLAVNAVLMMTLSVVVCRREKGYKAVALAESDSELAELQ